MNAILHDKMAGIVAETPTKPTKLPIQGWHPITVAIVAIGAFFAGTWAGIQFEHRVAVRSGAAVDDDDGFRYIDGQTTNDYLRIWKSVQGK